MLGDVRLNWDGLQYKEGAQAALCGTLASTGSMAPYTYDKSDKFMGFAMGTVENMAAELHASYKMMTWVLRIVGFVTMWVGLALMAGKNYSSIILGEIR
jgi:hydrogenase/urease accessory protein HupE